MIKQCLILLVFLIFLTTPGKFFQIHAQQCDGDQICGINGTVCTPTNCVVGITPGCTCDTQCFEYGTTIGCTGNTQYSCTFNKCANYSKCQAGNYCIWRNPPPTGGWGCTNPNTSTCSWVSNGTYTSESSCKTNCNPTTPTPPPPPPPPLCGSNNCNAGEECCRTANPFCFDPNAVPRLCGDPPSGCTAVSPWCNPSGSGTGGYASVPGAMHTGCDENMVAYESNGKIVIGSVKSDGSPCSYNWGGPDFGGLAVWEYPDSQWVPLSEALRPNYPDFASKTLTGFIPNNEWSITLDPINQDPNVSHKFIVNPACVTNARIGGTYGVTFEDSFVFNRDPDPSKRNPGSGITSELRWDDMKTNGCYREVIYTPTTTPQAKTCSVVINGSSFIEGTPITATVTGGANWSTTDTIRLFLEQTDITAPPIDFTITPAPYSTGDTSAPYYYQITDANCLSTNGATCTETVELSGLPPGGYYLHCDAPTDPLKCSGNPYCGYEGLGGPYTCSTWGSCSFSDNVNFEVTEGAPPAPVNLAATCNAAVAGQFLPTAITLSWDIVSEADSYLIKVTDGVAGDNINALNATDTSITYTDKIDCATTGTTDPDVCIRVSASINSIALNVDPDTFTGATTTWSVQAENTGGLSPVTTGTAITPCADTILIFGTVNIGTAGESGTVCTNQSSVPWNDTQPITVEVVNASESPPRLLGSDTTYNGAYSISVVAPNGANLTTRLAQPTNTGSVKVQCTNTADTATITWSYIPTRTNHIARIDSAGYCNNTTNGITTWIPWYCGALGDQYVNNAGSCQDNVCTLTRSITAERPYWGADIEPFEGAVAQPRVVSASFICPSYPLDTVAYAVQCPASGGFTITSDGSDQTFNFYVNNDFDPWWQVAGGNVYANTNLNVFIPDDTCSAAFPSCEPYLIAKELFGPSYSRLASRNSISAGIPISATGTISGTGYLTDRTTQTKSNASGAPSPTETYAYLEKIADPAVTGYTFQSDGSFNGIIDSLTDISGATSVNGTEVYYSNTSLTITPNTTIAVPANRKIIIFVNGTLTINGGSVPGSVTTVAPGGNLIFIVNGSINIAAAVGQTSETSTTPSLEGVFIGNFLTIASASPNADLKFVGAGTFVGQYAVNLNRDFTGNANGANRASPAELFIFRPDLVANWPELLKTSTTNWRELE